MERIDKIFSWNNLQWGILIAFSEGLEFNIMKDSHRPKWSLHCPSSRHSGKPYVLINYYVPKLETQQASVLDEQTKVRSN